MNDTVTTKPAIQGRGPSAPGDYDGRYRLYTVDHVPFDRFPSYSDGGPSTVTHNGWNISTSSTCRVFSSPSVVAADDGMHTLRVTRDGRYVDTGVIGPHGTPVKEYVVTRHPLDGTKYATKRDADRAAYEAGALAFMVYEKNAAKYDL